MDSVAGQSLASVPSFYVIAYGAVPQTGYSWLDSQTSTIDDLLNAAGERSRFVDPTYVLFANGSVGKVQSSGMRNLRFLFDVKTASKATKEELEKLGVRWIP